MSDKESAQNVIESYRKRQSMAARAPLLFGVAAVLIIAGAAVFIFWIAPRLQGGQGISLFATETATPSSTPTVTNTPEPTNTPTVTNTPEPSATLTPTETPTPSGPFLYKVQEGEFLADIIERFDVDLLTLLELNPDLDPDMIFVGQDIIIPPPGATLPTPTDVPADFRGTIEYRIVPGDMLLSIVERFNTTTDAILQDNPDVIESVNDPLFPGTILKIRPNLVTPRPTATIGTIYPTAPSIPTRTPSPTPTQE